MRSTPPGEPPPPKRQDHGTAEIALSSGLRGHACPTRGHGRTIGRESTFGRPSEGDLIAFFSVAVCGVTPSFETPAQRLSRMATGARYAAVRSGASEVQRVLDRLPHLARLSRGRSVSERLHCDTRLWLLVVARATAHPQLKQSLHSTSWFAVARGQAAKRRRPRNPRLAADPCSIRGTGEGIRATASPTHCPRPGVVTAVIT